MKKKKKNENSSKIFKYHDHGACFGYAITLIEDYFIEKKLQLTPLRRKVFEILIEDHKPLGAYEILDKLGKAGFSLSPPIAYRVLDFLMEHGFVHKVQGLNAFIACSNPEHSHFPTFVICRKCEKVAEVSDDKTRLNLSSPEITDFKIEKTTIELTGICSTCENTEIR